MCISLFSCIICYIILLADRFLKTNDFWGLFISFTSLFTQVSTSGHLYKKSSASGEMEPEVPVLQRKGESQKLFLGDIYQRASLHVFWDLQNKERWWRK